MSSLPSLSSSCLAPDNSGQNAILFGVSIPGRLDAYSVNLSNPLAPTATLVSSTSATVAPAWDAQQSLGCFAYLGDSPPLNSPITVIQFGNTVQALFYPTNGTWLTTMGAVTESGINYISPKTFSLVGSTAGWSWFLVNSASKGGSSGTSSWRSLRIGNRDEFGAPPETTTLTTMVGSEQLLLTVGAIAQDFGSFGNGLLFSFAKTGTSGTVLRALGNKQPPLNLTLSTEPLVNVTQIGAGARVDMNGNTLTSDASPVASGFAAFIVDKSAVGTVLIYSIDPRGSAFKLVLSPAQGRVPRFLPNQAIASLNSKIVIYGGLDPALSTPLNVIHTFDVISGIWSGPSLLDPVLGTGVGSGGSDEPKKLNVAMIGGIAAGAVVLILAVGVFVWRRKRRLASLASIGTHAITKGPPATKGKRDETLDIKYSTGHMHMSPLDQKERNPASESSITLTCTEPQTSVPGTPMSAHVQPTISAMSREAAQMQQHQNNHPYQQHHQHQQQQARQPSRSKPSRQSSVYSLRSNASSGHISLFPASSQIYFVDSPSMLAPPTPALPSAYAVVSSRQIPQQQESQPLQPPPRPSQQTQRLDSSSSFTTSVSKKASSNYRVNVPDDYDDCQPSHRLPSMDASSERTMSLDSKYNAPLKSAIKKSPRPSAREAFSTPSTMTTPLTSTTLITGATLVDQLLTSNSGNNNNGSSGGSGSGPPSSSKSRRKRNSDKSNSSSGSGSGSSNSRPRAEPLIIPSAIGGVTTNATMTSSPVSPRKASGRESVYKVEYRSPVLANSSVVGVPVPVVPSVPITPAVFATSPIFSSSSRSNSFPLPPKSSEISGTESPTSLPIMSPPSSSSSSSTTAGMTQQQEKLLQQQQQIYEQYKLDQKHRQQRQLQLQQEQEHMLWQLRQDEVQQQQQQLQQQGPIGSPMAVSMSPISSAAPSPKTPMLGSLPRPMPRDKKKW